MGRILGVDPGRRRVGLALSDEAEGRMALPFATVDRGRDDAKAAEKVRVALAGQPVQTAVVGLPLRLDGSEGEAARRGRRFGEALRAALGVDIVYWDERLTTVSAERGLRAMGVRGQAQRRVVDQAAAALILQGWLDAERFRRERESEADGGPLEGGAGWPGRSEARASEASDGPGAGGPDGDGREGEGP